MTDGALIKVSSTTFKEEKVLERAHLQAAIRDNMEVLDGDLLVVAEEFGDFEDTHRRIDLLCVDKTARLVVVELKRTEDDGHMELQALRYAAMVSTMIFMELCSIYAEHLRRTGAVEHDLEDARLQLLEWFEDDTGNEPVLGQEVGIVLVSANFSQEITTTVLWLNDQYGTDIRCIRLSPYRHQGRLLLDVQHVIPLPEAADFTVRLKKREAAARIARESSRDYTKYVISTPNKTSDPLPKRRAILFLVQALHAAGVAADVIAKAVPDGKMRSAPGTLEGDELWDALRAKYELTEQNRVRWFLDDPVHDGERTWVLFSNWETNTEPTLDALVATAPGFSYQSAV
jgi:hypothetical protein